MHSFSKIRLEYTGKYTKSIYFSVYKYVCTAICELLLSMCETDLNANVWNCRSFLVKAIAKSWLTSK